ncbi:hypothetical protein F5879DRAFT_932194 [Lentinula edodes]|nr:hypothetical protein F5879DRAFT_932194 [Lentinula edodes]
MSSLLITDMLFVSFFISILTERPQTSSVPSVTWASRESRRLRSSTSRRMSDPEARLSVTYPARCQRTREAETRLCPDSVNPRRYANTYNAFLIFSRTFLLRALK